MRCPFGRVLAALLAGGVSMLGAGGPRLGVAGAAGPPTAGGQWTVMQLPYREDFTVAQVGTQVLIAGGRNPVSDRVDTYDEASGVWTVAQLSQARSAIATATIGSWLLFAGGSTPAGPSDVVDLYDSPSGQWSTARLSSARALPGVAVVGTQALFAGGRAQNHDSDAVDIFDSAAGSWSVGQLSAAHTRLLVTAVGTQALIAGDREGETVDIYDAATGQWAHERTGVLFIPSVVGGQVVFLKPDDPDFQTAVVYDSRTSQWSSTRLSGPRSFLSAVATIGSRLLLAGGGRHPSDIPREVQIEIPVDSVDIFDGATSSWSQGRLSRPCIFSDARVATVGTQVLLAGCNTVPVSRVEVYDARVSGGGQSWRTSQLSQDRARMAVAVVGTQALFAGGVQGSPGTAVDTVDVYDGAAGTWSTAALSSARQVANVAVVGHLALFIGGWVPPDRVPVGPVVDVYSSDTSP